MSFEFLFALSSLFFGSLPQNSPQWCQMQQSTRWSCCWVFLLIVPHCPQSTGSRQSLVMATIGWLLASANTFLINLSNSIHFHCQPFSGSQPIASGNLPGIQYKLFLHSNSNRILFIFFWCTWFLFVKFSLFLSSLLFCFRAKGQSSKQQTQELWDC